jgi:hypothetical protein
MAFINIKDLNPATDFEIVVPETRPKELRSITIRSKPIKLHSGTETSYVPFGFPMHASDISAPDFVKDPTIAMPKAFGIKVFLALEKDSELYNALVKIDEWACASATKHSEVMFGKQLTDIEVKTRYISLVRMNNENDKAKFQVEVRLFNRDGVDRRTTVVHYEKIEGVVKQKIAKGWAQFQEIVSTEDNARGYQAQIAAQLGSIWFARSDFGLRLEALEFLLGRKNGQAGRQCAFDMDEQVLIADA